MFTISVRSFVSLMDTHGIKFNFYANDTWFYVKIEDVGDEYWGNVGSNIFQYGFHYTDCLEIFNANFIFLTFKVFLFK